MLIAIALSLAVVVLILIGIIYLLAKDAAVMATKAFELDDIYENDMRTCAEELSLAKKKIEGLTTLLDTSECRLTVEKQYSLASIDRIKILEQRESELENQVREHINTESQLRSVNVRHETHCLPDLVLSR